MRIQLLQQYHNQFVSQISKVRVAQIFLPLIGASFRLQLA